MKSVLIIAHSWPPDAFVGAVRPVYLAKQLARLGWRPVVVTVKEQYYECLNHGGIQGSNEAVVIRTHCLPSPRNAYVKAKSWIARLRGRHEEFLQQTSGMGAASELHPGSESGGATLKRAILSLLYTPDEFQGWFPFAFAAACRAIREHRVTCVISTGPPFTAHLVGLALKPVFGLPWVADFRDPWSWHEGRSAALQSNVANRLNMALEAKVLRSADRIVCVTPATTERYRKLYPKLPIEKWVTITNGYDREEFERLGAVPRGDRFTISYVGSFDFGRSPETLLQALGQMIEEGLIGKEEVTVRFVGPCHYAQGLPVAGLIDQYGLRDVVEVVGFVPRPEALQETLRADVLLVLGGNQRCTVGAKVYEYLAADRPILAIAEEGATADLIRHAGCGRVIQPGDVSGLKHALAALFEEHRRREQPGGSHRAVRDPSAIAPYDWNNLGEQYARLLEECVEQARIGDSKHAWRTGDRTMGDYWEGYALRDYDFYDFAPQSLVLDVGCGPGNQMQELERHGSRAIGVEVHWESLKNCRSRSLSVLQGSGEHMPVKSGVADGLVLKGVLPLTNEVRCMREIGRILKPNGIGYCCYLGPGYYLRYLLCSPSWKFRVYGLRSLVNTWWYIVTGTRLPGFIGDTVYQTRSRLAKYYAANQLKLLQETPSPAFLGLPVFLYHSIQKAG